MVKNSLYYQLPQDLGVLELSPDVLHHLDKYKQRKWWSREAGGQLFASDSIKGSLIKVFEATGPRPTDRRTKCSYEPDNQAEMKEINERKQKNLFFIGDWHTHPQKLPRPSHRDEKSMAEMIRSSEHEMPGFLLIIVGQAEFPEGIHISFHTKINSVKLNLVNYHR